MVNRIQEVEQYLSVGQTAVIHPLPARQGAPRLATTIRGWQAGTYILADIPVVEGRHVLLGLARSCIVRFLSQGSACGFGCVIEGEGSTRHPYFRLSWPRRIQTVRVRRHERLRMRVPCRLEIDGQDPFEGTVMDLSAGGCSVIAPYGLECGTVAGLTFELPDATPVAGARAVVRSVRSTQDGYLLGCMFDEDEVTARIGCDFYVSMMLHRMRGQDEASHRALVLDTDDSRGHSARSLLERNGCEVSVVRGVVDAFFSLRMAPPDSMWIAPGADEWSELDICRIVRKTTGFEKMPLYIYGGGGDSAATRDVESIVTGFVASVEGIGEVAPRVPSSEGRP